MEKISEYNTANNLRLGKEPKKRKGKFHHVLLDGILEGEKNEGLNLFFYNNLDNILKNILANSNNLHLKKIAQNFKKLSEGDERAAEKVAKLLKKGCKKKVY